MRTETHKRVMLCLVLVAARPRYTKRDVLFSWGGMLQDLDTQQGQYSLLMPDTASFECWKRRSAILSLTARCCKTVRQ